ncbi:MAG: PAS domain-containing sensor histidine kinase [Alphaproteobacteria bacterium]
MAKRENPGGRTDAELLTSLQRTVENAGIGLYETSVSGVIVFANQALAELLGFDSVDALKESGLTIHDFYEDPEDIRRFRGKVEKYQNVDSFLIRIRRPDGTKIWVSEKGAANFNDDGNIIGYTGSLTDVTELKDTQDRLAQAEEDYRRMFENMPIGIYRSSLDGRQLRSNPALWKLNGFVSEEDHLTSVKDIAKEWYVEPTRREDFKRELEEKGILENFESEIFRHRTRERIWIEETAYLVRDQDGNPLFYEGTVQEITQRKRAETSTLEAKDNAERANRSKSRFLANMSHELRTPLNSIIGFSDMIRQETFGPLENERYKDYIATIANSADMLLKLIDDILEIAKMDAGKLSLSLELLDLQIVISQCLHLLEQRMHNAGLSISVSIPKNLPPIEADARRIHQIMVNLLSNSVKHTDPGGTIEIRVAGYAEFVDIAVRDTGSGIPEDEMELVFVPFERSRDAVRLAKEGTGLGLPLARELARQHGGDLMLESTVGVGTTATLRLPSNRQS